MTGVVTRVVGLSLRLATTLVNIATVRTLVVLAVVLGAPIHQVRRPPRPHRHLRHPPQRQVEPLIVRLQTI